MKNYYFVATLKDDIQDKGVCFSKKKVAEAYRENEIRAFDQEQSGRPLNEQYNSRKAVRLVVSDCNYGFRVYSAIENRMDCEGIMPYDNRCSVFMHNKDGYDRAYPHFGEYQDIYVVRDADGYVVGMFTTDKKAMDFMEKKKNGRYTFECLRDIENGIDIREYFFVVEKKSGKAICFSDSTEAVKYAVHIHNSRDRIQFFKDGEFATFKAKNVYNKYNPKTVALTVHNTAQDVIDHFDERNFWFCSSELVDDALKGGITVCAVEFKTGEILHQFTDKHLAVRFNLLIGNPTVKTEGK